MISGNTKAGQIENLLAPHVKNLGYDLIDVEFQPGAPGGSILRLFIDSPKGTGVTHSDCVAVDHGLDTVFESAEFETVLSSTFVLEVSSPGLDRPLKKPADFEKYRGSKAMIKTFRPLTEEEMGNSNYFTHHQKQKNFGGVLKGFSQDSVEMETDKETFKIPLAAIAKANLDIASGIDVDKTKD